MFKDSQNSITHQESNQHAHGGSYCLITESLMVTAEAKDRPGHRPSDLLSQLVSGRREELKGWWSIQPPSLETGGDLLRSLQLTPGFRQRYEEAARFHQAPRSDDELRRFRSRLAGAEFAEAASLYCQFMQPPATVVLSAEQTLKFYNKLYPNARRIYHPLGLDSLAGIRVPDGMVIGRNTRRAVGILAICEFTLSGARDSFDKSYRGFLRGKRYFPELFYSTTLLFAIPKAADLPVSTRRFIRDGVELVELPFTHVDFRDYLDSLYQSYRLDQDSATLLEVQTRAVINLKENHS